MEHSISNNSNIMVDKPPPPPPLAYLLVPGCAEGVLNGVGWVPALLTAEAPLAGGIPRATGHPGLG